MRGFLSEPAREVPIIDKTDVLVVGGGVAGMAAAVAAKRLGCSVILTERYNFLGGSATGGNILLWFGFQKGESKTYTGLPLEVMNEIDRLKGVYYTEGHLTPFAFVDPEVLKYVLQDITIRSGVNLIGHLLAVNMVTEDNIVKAVVFEGKSQRSAITAKIVIDTTGDGDLLSWAGIPYQRSHLPVSFSWTLGGAKSNNHLINDHLTSTFRSLVRQLRIKTNNLQPHPSRGALWCNGIHFLEKDSLNVKDLTSVDCEGRARVVQLLELMKEKIPECENCFLMHTSSVTGVRTSRQCRGEYTLTKEDVQKGARFEDSVGIMETAPFYGESPAEKVNCFEIPLRCLLPQNTKNLLVAGRCISVPPAQNKFESPLEDIRLIAPCMVSGQAAGCVAALSCTRNERPSELSINKLQSALISQGVKCKIDQG